MNKPQINYPISRNPWQVIISGPVNGLKCNYRSVKQEDFLNSAAAVNQKWLEGREGGGVPPCTVPDLLANFSGSNDTVEHGETVFALTRTLCRGKFAHYPGWYLKMLAALSMVPRPLLPAKLHLHDWVAYRLGGERREREADRQRAVQTSIVPPVGIDGDLQFEKSLCLVCSFASRWHY